MKRFNFFIVNITAVVALFFSIVNFNTVNKKYTNIVVDYISKVEASLGKEDIKIHFEKILLESNLVLLNDKNVSRKDILNKALYKSFPSLSLEERKIITNEIIIYQSSFGAVFVSFVLVLSFGLIVYLFFFRNRLYVYYGNNSLFRDLFVFLIPFSSIYYMLRKGVEFDCGCYENKIEVLEKNTGIENRLIFKEKMTELIDKTENKTMKIFKDLSIRNWVFIYRNLMKVIISLFSVILINSIFNFSYLFVTNSSLSTILLVIFTSLILILLICYFIYKIDTFQLKKVELFKELDD